MIIDFHTHQFPDKIAKKTVEMLAEKLKSTSGISPFTDGTAGDLSKKLAEAGIDLGVVMPVLTRPGQFDTVNMTAGELNRAHPTLLSFGGIHPEDPDISGHMAKIAALGLPGVKIHPDYQGVKIDDERYVRIAKEALYHGLILLTHSGVDDGVPGEVHCPPERAARFLSAVYEGKDPAEARIVFAHGGANRQFDGALTHLGGWNVWFDLSYIDAYATDEDFLRIIRGRGADLTLFGSDCPWGDPGRTLQRIRSLPLTKAEETAILGGNARRLLKI